MIGCGLHLTVRRTYSKLFLKTKLTNNQRTNLIPWDLLKISGSNLVEFFSRALFAECWTPPPWMLFLAWRISSNFFRPTLWIWPHLRILADVPKPHLWLMFRLHLYYFLIHRNFPNTAVMGPLALENFLDQRGIICRAVLKGFVGHREWCHPNSDNLAIHGNRKNSNWIFSSFFHGVYPPLYVFCVFFQFGQFKAESASSRSSKLFYPRCFTVSIAISGFCCSSCLRRHHNPEKALLSLKPGYAAPWRRGHRRL
ncbi:hypothetical protein SDJN03_19479, partial [Cucurbita argyrosperma subsp. sororia]